MSEQPREIKPTLALGARHIELLTGSADTNCHFRLLRGAGFGRNLSGNLGALWSIIDAGQRDGWQVFVVVNEGGHTTAEIARVRALFVDGDGVPTPLFWHARPDFIVRRDATHWHAYWLVADMPKAEFKSAQRRLAACYGTDPKVCDLPRVMRLAGSLHLKDAARPLLVTIEGDECARQPRGARSAVELLAGLPETAVATRSVTAVPLGEPISLEILADVLGHLDPGCDRNEWRDIIAALRAAPVPDDDDESGRRQLAHEWSERGHNYTGPEDVDRVFNDMVPGGGINVGTLIAKARGAGYDGPISIAGAERLAAFQATAEQWAASAFWDRLIAASQGAIQRMPEPQSRPLSPDFVEQMKHRVIEDQWRGEELARKWGLR